MLINRYEKLKRLCKEKGVPENFNRELMFLDALAVRGILGIHIEEYVQNEYYDCETRRGLRWYCQHYDTHRGYVWILCDLINCRVKYGIRVDEYFRNEFYNLRWPCRDEYLTQGPKVKMMAICNAKEIIPEIDDKAKINKNFSEFLKRRWIDLEYAELSELQCFAATVQTGFLKYIQ